MTVGSDSGSEVGIAELGAVVTDAAFSFSHGDGWAVVGSASASKADIAELDAIVVEEAAFSFSSLSSTTLSFSSLIEASCDPIR